MSVHGCVRWAKGGTAVVVSLDADKITVRSSTPSAPGSRPEGALPSGARFWMKVARCRKEADGFVIDGRVLDATRDTRHELGRLAEPASNGKTPSEPSPITDAAEAVAARSVDPPRR